MNPREKALNLLDAWISAEVLKPAEFTNSIDDGRPAQSMRIIQNGCLPWEAGYPEVDIDGDYDGFLCYDVILGYVDQQKATTMFANIYGQPVEDIRPTSDKAILATLRVSRDGTLDKKQPFLISSYGWGLIKALNRNFETLAKWGMAEAGLNAQFFNKFEEEGKVQVTLDLVQQIYYWLLDSIGGVPPYVHRPGQSSDLIMKPEQVVGYYKQAPKRWLNKEGVEQIAEPNQKSPEPLFMNSFFLTDLVAARYDVENERESPALAEYLGIVQPEKQIDLLKDRKLIEELLTPEKFPMGKWPVKGRHSLNTLQQTAINYIISNENKRITAIDGPPGTGKTTLFKDAFAGLYVKRAIALSKFTDPSRAFNVKRGLMGFQLDKSLRGYEIVVASSNNNAVKNVSEEWPSPDAIADDSDLTYLPELATLLNDRPGWGMISLVLGNTGNRYKAVNRLWYDEDYGLSNHLYHATGGRPKVIPKKNSEVPREPKSIQAHKVPGSRKEALENWRKAREEMLEALRLVEEDHAKATTKAPGWSEGMDYKDFHMMSPVADLFDTRLMENLFEASVKLHRAFMDASATEMRTNLGLAMDILKNKRFPSATAENAFATLFLVAPVISTTFASVNRMFNSLPEDSLGYAFIDEAGQGSVQDAVGLLRKFKHAIVVGDNLQIEPVVTINQKVLDEIAKTFHLEMTEAMAPYASVQTFANHSNKYIAEFGLDDMVRHVGMPLLVHRRCESPMFDISNELAYDNLMINATPARESAIRERLKESRWIDVGGPDRPLTTMSNNKFSPDEGEIVIKILANIARINQLENIFVITPFREVAKGMREMVYQNRARLGIDIKQAKALQKRIGTTHTAQGREADTVIMLMGAQGQKYANSRAWAGSTPNILNVAVTRAKSNLYVVGNKEEWRGAGFFIVLAREFDDINYPANDTVKAEEASPAP